MCCLAIIYLLGVFWAKVDEKKEEEAEQRRIAERYREAERHREAEQRRIAEQREAEQRREAERQRRQGIAELEKKQEQAPPTGLKLKYTIQALEGNSGFVTSITWSPDGSILAYSPKITGSRIGSNQNAILEYKNLEESRYA